MAKMFSGGGEKEELYRCDCIKLLLSITPATVYSEYDT